MRLHGILCLQGNAGRDEQRAHALFRRAIYSNRVTAARRHAEFCELRGVFSQMTLFYR